MKQYILPENVAQALLAFLGTQPYTQVVQLIAALGQLEEVPQAPQKMAGPDAAVVAENLARIKRSRAKKPSKAVTKADK